MTNNNDELFTISNLEHHGELISATLYINKDCDVFNGHFPGQPVVPGAYMLQIVKEVLEKALRISYRLKKADHLKFIVMVDPTNTPALQLDLSYKHADKNALSVTGKLVTGDVVCFKFQGTFTGE